MSMRRFVSVGPALVVLVAGALLLVAGPGVVRRLSAARTAGIIEVSRKSLADDDLLARLDHANRLVTQSVTASVVHVDVVLEGQRGASTGAGWVFDDEGHIVTNAHVVANYRRVQVQFEDGFTKSAEVVGMDVFSDIAVLKVEAGNWLFPMARADGHELEVGDRVFAFGSPFGLKFSVSQGIVSGLGRSARAAMGFTGISNYIQTDAAVNPGNSGGPLVNSMGELIGMNVAIANAISSGSSNFEGQSAGISFAIPLGTIEARVSQIIDSGAATPAILGIEYSVAGPAFLNVEGYRGPAVRVNRVVADGPADKGGILAGDLLVSFRGESVGNIDVMRALISTARPGQEVEARVWRDGAMKDLVVRLAAAPDSFQEEQVRYLIADRCGLDLGDYSGGVMVWSATAGSPASDAGFEAGMLLTRIGAQNIDSLRDTYKAFVAAGIGQGKGVPVTVKLVDGTERSLTLRVFGLPSR